MKKNKTNNKDKNNKETEVIEETEVEKLNIPKENKTEVSTKPKSNIQEEKKPDGTIHRYVWVKSASGEIIKHSIVDMDKIFKGE
jgi:hypothetical protein